MAAAAAAIAAGAAATAPPTQRVVVVEDVSAQAHVRVDDSEGSTGAARYSTMVLTLLPPLPASGAPTPVAVVCVRPWARAVAPGASWPPLMVEAPPSLCALSVAAAASVAATAPAECTPRLALTPLAHDDIVAATSVSATLLRPRAGAPAASGSLDVFSTWPGTPPTERRQLLAALFAGVVAVDGQVVCQPLFSGGSRRDTAVRLHLMPADRPVRIVPGVTAFAPTMSGGASSALTTDVVVPTREQWVADACARAPAHATLIDSLVSIVGDALHRWDDDDAPGSTKRARAHGVLLVGGTGTGKSAVAGAVAAAAGVRAVEVLTSHTLFRGATGASEARLGAALERVRVCGREVGGGGGIVIIDDVESLLPARPRSDLAARCAALLLAAMDAVSAADERVAFIALASSPDAADARSRGASRLPLTLTRGMLTPPERLALLRGMPGTGDVLPAVLEVVASRTHGYTPADLVGCVREAVARCAGRSVDAPTTLADALVAVLPSHAPSLLAEAVGSPPSPTASLADLVGQPAAVGAALHALASAFTHAHTFAAAGLSPPAGMLITGPRGSGKTALAHALARHAMATGLTNALVVSGPEIVSALVGASEARLAAAFARARELAPCILLFDQFELLAPARSYAALGGPAHDRASSHSFDRLLSVLLTEMDGVASGGASAVSSLAPAAATVAQVVGPAAAALPPTLRAASLSEVLEPGVTPSSAASVAAVTPTPTTAAAVPHVFVIAVTHAPEELDAAVVRPGRIDVTIEMEPLDAARRRDLLLHFFARSGVSPTADTVLPVGDVSTCQRGAALLAGLTGADGTVPWVQLAAAIAAAMAPDTTPADAVALWYDASMATVRRAVAAAMPAAAVPEPDITAADILAASGVYFAPDAP